MIQNLTNMFNSQNKYVTITLGNGCVYYIPNGTNVEKIDGDTLFRLAVIVVDYGINVVTKGGLRLGCLSDRVGFKELIAKLIEIEPKPTVVRNPFQNEFPPQYTLGEHQKLPTETYMMNIPKKRSANENTAYIFSLDDDFINQSHKPIL